MSEHFDVTIVGAGHAGAQAAIALRSGGFAGSIALISDEADYPYERPPLSKDFLAGTKPFERMLIRKPDYWQSKEVTLLRECTIAAVDSQARCLTTATGEAIGYGDLIWASGGRARRLQCAGAQAQGVHVVRSSADVRAILAVLGDVQQVAIIGGGYIGLEAAAVLRGLGKQVTVLEAQNRVLARVAGADISRFYETIHRTHGVDIRLDVQVEAIEETEGSAETRRACGVRLADGTQIPAQLIIVGIGIVPAVEPLLTAGAQAHAPSANGVLIDNRCRVIDAKSPAETSTQPQAPLPNIYAIGDCAAHANRYAEGAVIRLESVQNAHDQAQVAAANILASNADEIADKQVYSAVPWFWSQQYDLKLQTVGLSASHEQAVIRGDIESQSFSIVYLRGGRVVALDCVNRPRDYVQGRALVVNGISATPAQLSNPDIALKELVAG